MEHSFGYYPEKGAESAYEVHKRYGIGHIVLKYFFGVLSFLAVAAVFGFVVMFLWNRLLPSIFGFPIINYLQAVGLLILARVLFGGIGGGTVNNFAGKNPFLNKWMGMNKKEREAFLQKHGQFFHDHQDIHGSETKP